MEWAGWSRNLDRWEIRSFTLHWFDWGCFFRLHGLFCKWFVSMMGYTLPQFSTHMILCIDLSDHESSKFIRFSGLWFISIFALFRSESWIVAVKFMKSCCIFFGIHYLLFSYFPILFLLIETDYTRLSNRFLKIWDILRYEFLNFLQYLSLIYLTQGCKSIYFVLFEFWLSTMTLIAI